MSPPDLRQEAERRAQAGDLHGAAEVFARAGLYFEAARSLHSASDAAAALAQVTRVQPDHATYREACALAVALAEEQDRLSLTLENFLAPFLRTAAASDAEVETLATLTRLYERHGFPENAAEIIRKLAAHRPEYAAAAALLSPPAPPAPGLPDLVPSSPKPGSDGAIPVGRSATASHEDAQAYRPGAVIAGRYRLEERIGTGGMSVVFRASDLDLGDQVAVKVLTRAVFDAETDARLRREMMLSRQLVHRNIVRVFETGLAHGLHYLIMELLMGIRLPDRLRAGPMALDEALDYLGQACAGLQAAHEMGVVHRDVKPGNLFVAAGGVLKVMDFGLAKLRNAPGLTASGVIAGTPEYMAPEQAGDFRSVTPAADIYALGVVAYEMFTGMLPFVHENPLAVLQMHRDAPPPPPRSRNPSLPETAERFALRCLEKSPARRFGSCREMAQHLLGLRAQRPGR